MCGIAGIYSFNKESARYQISVFQMLKKMHHRGPEQTNVRVGKRWGLGISRLSIIDLTNKENVFTAAQGKITYVVNGEIFNYKELRQELIEKGYKFRSKCDSEVVGFLYEEYGIRFINRLNGQFAIIMYDERDDKVILIRDHFGIVPLFYHVDEHRCTFASELIALTSLAYVKKEFNPIALDQLFTFWTTIGSTTFLKNIFQVRPSHYVEITRKGVSERAYYALDLSEEIVDNSLTLSRAKQLVRQTLIDSVKIRLEASDVEIGAYLSGGIDSSIITKLAEQIKGNALQTFSINFIDKLYSEKKFQDAFFSTTSVINNRIDIDCADIVSNLEKVIEHTGQPIFRTAPIPLFVLSNFVNRNGIKVVLTGEGADEIFWGYDTFKELKIRKFWSNKPESRYRPFLFKKIFPQFPHFDAKYNAFISAFYKKDLLTEEKDFFSHLPRWNNSSPLKAIFSQELKQELSDYNCFEDLRRQLPTKFDQLSGLSKCQYLEMMTLLPGYLLSSQGDRMAFAHSVECRIPFLDRRVVELCAKLPHQYKMKSLIDKYILRETFKDLLPSEIYNRPKNAYQAPELTAFTKNAKGSYIEHYLSEDVTKTVGLFNPRKVCMLYNKVVNSGNASRVGTQNNMAFIQTLSTHIFYSKYIQSV